MFDDVKQKTVKKTAENAKGKALKTTRRVSEDEPPVASNINGRRCSSDSANEVPVSDYWPVLSQAFVNEIEGDDADNAQEESASEEESEDEEESDSSSSSSDASSRKKHKKKVKAKNKNSYASNSLVFSRWPQH